MTNAATLPVLVLVLAFVGARTAPSAMAQETTTQTERSLQRENQQLGSTTQSPANSPSQANSLLRRVIETLVHGPAFDAKVRETVWTGGRQVVGVGTYEQAGLGSGRYNLQVTMHDGDGKHRLQQISDGRLAWTRSEIAGNVSLRRVDVGRLDQWVQGVSLPLPIAPRLQVGAWAEMLTSFLRDYQLQVEGAHLKGQPVWVITGRLNQQRRDQVMAEAGLEQWPMLFPTRVRVAVQSEPESGTQFGAFLPVRIEFWSDPLRKVEAAAAESKLSEEGRLITLIEIYSLRPISAPPVERFRFENQDAEVNFTNDTDRYIQQFGVQLTERQRRQLRR
ncbi:MAG: hypothetical protein P8L85_01915 [Rubripirellula sp.]|nr:hypothetical protein [Rubripirellula sp.]